MPTYNQIVVARAGQTQGVWNLDPAFTVGGIGKGEHASQISTAIFARAAKDTAAGEVKTAERDVRTELDFFKGMNTPISERLDSEVPDTDPLQRRVDEANNIPPKSEAQIERRTELTIVIWKEVNAARAAQVPALPPITVRGNTVGQYETRYQALLPKRLTRDEKDGVLAAKRSAERRETRRLDTWNKNWHQAWKSEYAAGTEKGDALSQVDTEDGTLPPQPLLISSLTQNALFINVAYDQDSGAHATVLELLFKIQGVDEDWQRVTADKIGGNIIGPFEAGQTIILATDVGNSRDFSEMSDPQSITLN
jgi:hypothetical protein